MAMVMDFERLGVSVDGGIIRIENPQVRGNVVVMCLAYYYNQEQVDAGKPMDSKRVSFSLEDFGGKAGFSYAKAYELVMALEEYADATSDEQ